MTKKIFIFSLVCFILMLTGCVSADKAPAESPAAPELNAATAVEKVATAQQIFFNVMSGGSDVVYEPFDFEGYPYFYMGESLESWEKLRGYLGDIYTDDAIDLFIEYSGIIEHEGRLAHPDAAMGSLVDWSKAEVISIEDENGQKTFELEVSYDVYTENVPFTFVIENGIWKLNYPLLY